MPPKLPSKKSKNAAPAAVSSQDAEDESDYEDTMSDASAVLLMQLAKDMKTLMTDVGVIKARLNEAIESSTEQSKKITVLEKKNSDLETEVQLLKNEIVTMKSQCNDQKAKITDLEMYQRRENLIFYGIPSMPDENCVERIKWVLEHDMKIADVQSIKFDRCHRLKSRKDPTPIICRFNWSEDRNCVWKARKNLKDSNVSVSEDFPFEVMSRRKYLYQIMVAARKMKKIS